MKGIMKTIRFVTLSVIVLALSTGLSSAQQGYQPAQLDRRETAHLRNIKQITFGGSNAEAYFSYDGKQIIFQSTREPYKCDQMFTMNLDGSSLKLVSTGKGRTTCGYFTPDGKRIIY